MDAWKKRELNKRWEILQGQTLNMAWMEICNDKSEGFEEKLEALKDRYPRLLKVNAELVLGEGKKPSSV